MLVCTKTPFLEMFIKMLQYCHIATVKKIHELQEYPKSQIKSFKRLKKVQESPRRFIKDKKNLTMKLPEDLKWSKDSIKVLDGSRSSKKFQ